jgi:hypothetical protein
MFDFIKNKFFYLFINFLEIKNKISDYEKYMHQIRF